MKRCLENFGSEIFLEKLQQLFKDVHLPLDSEMKKMEQGLKKTKVMKMYTSYNPYNSRQKLGYFENSTYRFLQLFPK